MTADMQSHRIRSKQKSAGSRIQCLKKEPQDNQMVLRKMKTDGECNKWCISEVLSRYV